MLIPVEHVDIYWNSDKFGHHFDLVVCDRREIVRGQDGQKSFFQGKSLTELMSSAGCHCAEWNESEYCYLKPEGVFGIVLSGFKSWPPKEVFIKILTEFSRIDSCSWARIMLEGLRDADPELDMEEN